jgi:hypothetical protein
MALCKLTQCETRWWVALTSFDERYGKVIADCLDVKKEVDLVQASIVQIGQLVQNLPKVNGNGAKWKQLVDRAEADRHTFCKFLNGQMLYTSLFHTYAGAYREMRDSLGLGQEDASQAEQNKHQKKDRNSEAECCTRKQKRPPPTYQNPWLMATNNFFAPLRDLPVLDSETSSEGNSTRTPETNDTYRQR